MTRVSVSFEFQLSPRGGSVGPLFPQMLVVLGKSVGTLTAASLAKVDCFEILQHGLISCSVSLLPD